MVCSRSPSQATTEGYAAGTVRIDGNTKIDYDEGRLLSTKISDYVVRQQEGGVRGDVQDDFSDNA